MSEDVPPYETKRDMDDTRPMRLWDLIGQWTERQKYLDALLNETLRENTLARNTYGALAMELNRVVSDLRGLLVLGQVSADEAGRDDFGTGFRAGVRSVLGDPPKASAAGEVER